MSSVNTGSKSDAPAFWEDLTSSLASMQDHHKYFDFLLAHASTWTDAQITEATQYLVCQVRRTEYLDLERVLSSLGALPCEVAVKLIADPKLYQQMTTPTLEYAGFATPFCRACRLLGDSPPVEWIPIMAPYLTCGIQEVRQSAARMIGAAGASHV